MARSPDPRIAARAPHRASGANAPTHLAASARDRTTHANAPPDFTASAPARTTHANAPTRLAALALACGLVAAGCEVASAATAAEREAKKAEREAKKAAREAKQAAREAKKPPTPAPPAAPTPAPRPAPAKPPSAGPTLPPCPSDNPLTFRSFGAGFLRTWCTGCHSSTLPEADRQDAPTDVNFDTHALYLPHANDVYARAVVEAHALAADADASVAPMPPAGLVPEPELRRLAQWIACGSPTQ